MQPTVRFFLLWAAGSGLLAVALGAFAAHGLRASLEPRLLQVFQTGVQYQMYHALALLGVVALLSYRSHRWLAMAGWCFIAGTLLFSGSLYILALGGPRWLGPITPIGGFFFLAGWSSIFVAAWQGRITAAK